MLVFLLWLSTLNSSIYHFNHFKVCSWVALCSRCCAAVPTLHLQKLFIFSN